MAERRGNHDAEANTKVTTPVSVKLQNSNAHMHAPVQENSMLIVDSQVNAGNLYGTMPRHETRHLHSHTQANYVAYCDTPLNEPDLQVNIASTSSGVVIPGQLVEKQQHEHQQQPRRQQVWSMNQHQNITQQHACAHDPKQQEKQLQPQQELHQQNTGLTPAVPGEGWSMSVLGTLQNLAVANNNHGNGTDEKVRHVKRPLNSFMIWSREMRKKLAQECPKMRHSQLSIRLGIMWKSLSEAQKQPYTDEAEMKRKLHKIQHPDYKFHYKKKCSKENKNPLDAVSLPVGNTSQRSAETEAFAVQSARSDTHCSVQNRYMPNGSVVSDNSLSYQQYHHVSYGAHTSADGGYSPHNPLSLPNTTTPNSSMNGSSYALYTTEGAVPVEGPSPHYTSQQQTQQLRSHTPWQIPSGTSIISEPASQPSVGFHATTPVAVTTQSGAGGCEGGDTKCEFGNSVLDADATTYLQEFVDSMFLYMPSVTPSPFAETKYSVSHQQNNHVSYCGHTSAAGDYSPHNSSLPLPNTRTPYSSMNESSYGFSTTEGATPVEGPSSYHMSQGEPQQMSCQIPSEKSIESERLSQPSVGHSGTTSPHVTTLSGAGGCEGGDTMKCEFENGVPDADATKYHHEFIDSMSVNMPSVTPSPLPETNNSVSHQQYHHVSYDGHMSAARGYSPYDSRLSRPNTTTPNSFTNGSSDGFYTTEGAMPVEGSSPSHTIQQAPQKLRSHMSCQIPSETSMESELMSQPSFGHPATTPMKVTTLSGAGGCEGGDTMKCEFGNDFSDADETFDLHEVADSISANLSSSPLPETDNSVSHQQNHHISASGGYSINSSLSLADTTTANSFTSGSPDGFHTTEGAMKVEGSSPCHTIQQAPQKLSSQMSSQIQSETSMESDPISQPSVGYPATTPLDVTTLSGAGGYECDDTMNCEFGNDLPDVEETTTMRGLINWAIYEMLSESTSPLAETEIK